MITGLSIVAQKVIIQGTIRDEITRAPIPNVNITVSGTAQGAVSDSRCRFRQQVPFPGEVVDGPLFRGRCDNFQVSIPIPGCIAEKAAAVTVSHFQVQDDQ